MIFHKCGKNKKKTQNRVIHPVIFKEFLGALHAASHFVVENSSQPKSYRLFFPVSYQWFVISRASLWVISFKCIQMQTPKKGFQGSCKTHCHRNLDTWERRIVHVYLWVVFWVNLVIFRHIPENKAIHGTTMPTS